MRSFCAQNVHLGGGSKSSSHALNTTYKAYSRWSLLFPPQHFPLLIRSARPQHPPPAAPPRTWRLYPEIPPHRAAPRPKRCLSRALINVGQRKEYTDGPLRRQAPGYFTQPALSSLAAPPGRQQRSVMGRRGLHQAGG